VRAADGVKWGRIADIYLTGRAWRVEHCVAAGRGKTRVLLDAAQIARFSSVDSCALLRLPSGSISALPRASSARPVSQQYASLAKNSLQANPHLHSARALFGYALEWDREHRGVLADFLFDEATWEIRALSVEWLMEGRVLQFHLAPRAVRQISCATQRILLREFEPVMISEPPVTAILGPVLLPSASAAA